MPAEVANRVPQTFRCGARASWLFFVWSRPAPSGKFQKLSVDQAASIGLTNSSTRPLMSQVRAIEILLRKSVPDLTKTEVQMSSSR
jgi:hypothetical protein